jgi:hypothetical protein
MQWKGNDDDRFQQQERSISIECGAKKSIFLWAFLLNDLFCHDRMTHATVPLIFSIRRTGGDTVKWWQMNCDVAM